MNIEDPRKILSTPRAGRRLVRNVVNTESAECDALLAILRDSRESWDHDEWCNELLKLDYSPLIVAEFLSAYPEK